MHQLVESYVRRKKWEGRVIAVAVLNALGEGMGGSAGASDVRSSTYIAGHRVISADEMMQRIQ